MPYIIANIDNKEYKIGCVEGQTEYVANIAERLNQFMLQLREEFPQLQHNQLVMMAALMKLESTELARIDLQKALQVVAKSADELERTIGF